MGWEKLERSEGHGTVNEGLLLDGGNRSRRPGNIVAPRLRSVKMLLD